MPRTTRRMPPVEGVAAGNTATLRLPIGLTYHQLLITLVGGTPADLDAVRVIGDGETFQTFRAGAHIDEVNQDEGRQPFGTVGEVLVLDFDRFGMITRAGREFTAIGTNHGDDGRPLSTLSVEFDLAAAAAVTGIQVKAIQSSPVPLGLVKKIRRFTYDAPAAGEFEIADLPKGDLINKIYFGATEIDKAKIERDNFVVFERTADENNVVRQDHGRGLGPFGGFVFDPTEEGYASESLVTERVRDLRITLTMSAPNNQIPVHVEYIGQLQV